MKSKFAEQVVPLKKFHWQTCVGGDTAIISIADCRRIGHNFHLHRSLPPPPSQSNYHEYTRKRKTKLVALYIWRGCLCIRREYISCTTHLSEMELSIC